MEPWYVAIAFKPLLLIGFLFVVAVSAWGLKRVWPQWAFKELLFDKQFKDKHPLAATLIGIGTLFGIVIGIGVLIRLLGLQL